MPIREESFRIGCGRQSDEKTAEGIEMLVNHFGERMLVGAGTVLTKEQAELTAKAGGRFIISPDTNAEVIKRTKALGLVSIPGALTPTEIAAASASGADFVKLFPVGSFGADYVKAVKAPLSNIRLLGVGGIDENNMAQYFAAGICGVGIGSGIVKKQMLDSGDFDGVRTLARTYTERIAALSPR